MLGLKLVEHKSPRTGFEPKSFISRETISQYIYTPAFERGLSPYMLGLELAANKSPRKGFGPIFHALSAQILFEPNTDPYSISTYGFKSRSRTFVFYQFRKRDSSKSREFYSRDSRESKSAGLRRYSL